jgi:hypothetical protein
LKEGEAERVLDGEVLGPEGEVTFNEFWKAMQQNPGPSGPALAVWRKLSREDRRNIGNMIGPHGLGLDGMWACTWLAARRWTGAKTAATSSHGGYSTGADCRAKALQRGMEC